MASALTDQHAPYGQRARGAGHTVLTVMQPVKANLSLTLGHGRRQVLRADMQQSGHCAALYDGFGHLHLSADLPQDPADVGGLQVGMGGVGRGQGVKGHKGVEQGSSRPSGGQLRRGVVGDSQGKGQQMRSGEGLLLEDVCVEVADALLSSAREG